MSPAAWNGRLLPPVLPHNVLQILRVVFDANIFHNFRFFEQRGMPVKSKRLGICTGIVDGHFEFQMAEVFTPVALGYMQFFRVRMRRATTRGCRPS